MKQPLVILVIVIVAAVLLIAAVAFVLQHNTKNTQDAVCAKYNIPERSCTRAKAAGYYCPSWDSNGGISPQYCIRIK